MKRLLSTIISITFIACMITSLSGCSGSLSAHAISVTPKLTIVNSNIGEQQSVKVNIVDSRKHKVIGTRGGKNRNTALITASNDISAALAEAAQKSLIQQGFAPYKEGFNSSEITIYIDKITYDPAAQSLMSLVDLSVHLRIEATKKTLIHRAQYRTEKRHKQFKTPKSSENQILINEVMSETLNRAFNDKDLLTFLAS